MKRIASVIVCMIFLVCLLLGNWAKATNPYKDLVHREVILHAAFGGTTVYMARDKEAFTELIAMLIEKDNKKILPLIMEGKVFEVNDGTKAKVLDIDYELGKAKVKLLEGGRQGSEGWIMVESLEGN